MGILPGDGPGYLNYTLEGYVDLTYMDVENPPIFHPYQFEVYNYRAWVRFIDMNNWIAYVAGAIYLAVIFGLQQFMNDKRALDLKVQMAFWNGALGLFSIMGFIRTSPEFFYIFTQEDGFWKSICVRQGANYPFAFWAILFILSKFVELGDTVFLVLRKKPVVFLQWYHHLATMIVTWITTPLLEPIARYYLVMNFGVSKYYYPQVQLAVSTIRKVHSLMYPYFALTALGIHIPRSIANFITTCQLTQMLIGLFVNVLSAYFHYAGSGCQRHPTSLKLFLAVYGSFTYLFGKLYYEKVMLPGIESIHV